MYDDGLETLGFKVVVDLSCREVDWDAFQFLSGACDGVVAGSIGGGDNFVVVAFGGDMTVAGASNGGCVATRVDNDITHDDELRFFHPGILFLILTLSKTNLFRFL